MRNLTHWAVGWLLACAFTTPVTQAALSGVDPQSYVYRNPHHPSVRVHVILPPTLNPQSRLLFVMHGQARDAQQYCADWAGYGRSNDTVVLCPEFSSKSWPGLRGYSQGNVFRDAAYTQLNPVGKWAFTALLNIQADARVRFGLQREEWDIWGHSGGAQFVHRLMLFKPLAPIRVAMAANAGWYLWPDPAKVYPCGPANALLSFTTDDLLAWSRRQVVLFLGTADTDPDDPDTGGCMDEQGLGRYQRGQNFHAAMGRLNPATTWVRIDVPGVGHDHTGMAPAAQSFLHAYNATHP